MRLHVTYLAEVSTMPKTDVAYGIEKRSKDFDL
jgi:hypothetical protein